jgi:hypothetical protein
MQAGNTELRYSVAEAGRVDVKPTQRSATVLTHLARQQSMQAANTEQRYSVADAGWVEV